MPQDKYTATWVSHTSIADFLACPRAYFLKHVYRDPGTKRKIKLMSPSLALGSAVHDALEALSRIPKASRFNEPLMVRFDRAWESVSGQQGGFFDADTEYRYKTRGARMIRRASEHPGPLAELSVKLKMDLPYYWIDEEENIILCGRVDWIEFLPETDSVHIIDFKTGTKEEDDASLQLPAYHLLVSHCQKRLVTKSSYWYLEHSDALSPKNISDIALSEKKILEVARKIKLSRQLDHLKCPNGAEGCRDCLPFEAVLRKEGISVGVDGYGYDVYILPPKRAEIEQDSEIL